MRILQVSPSPYVDNQGVAVHVRNIAERLAKKHDVTVFVPMDRNSRVRRERINGVNVERFKCYAPNDSYVFTVDMPLRMMKEEFDIVHAHGYHCFPLHLSAVLARRKQFVVTLHFHGVGHSGFRNGLMQAFRLVGKRTVAKADKVVAVSEYEKSLICEHLNICKDRVTVVPNGVSFSEFVGLRKEKRDFKSVLFVGYLAPFKGAQYLVEALPKLNEDVVLEIVGRGPLKPYLEKRARDLGVEGRVRFFSHLSRIELLQKFTDADVFALLSRYEAYSIVVAEALAAGTPCVVAKTSALTEWVDDEACFGVNFPIRTGELSQKINHVLENGSSGQAIKRWLGGKILDWNDVAAKVEQVYFQCKGA